MWLLIIYSKLCMYIHIHIYQKFIQLKQTSLQTISFQLNVKNTKISALVAVAIIPNNVGEYPLDRI